MSRFGQNPSPLEDRLGDAVSDLRDRVDELAVPVFKPKRRVAAPLLAALVLIAGIGVTAQYVRGPDDERGDLSVVTEPDVTDTSDPDPVDPDPTAVEIPKPDPDSETETRSPEPTQATQAAQATEPESDAESSVPEPNPETKAGVEPRLTEPSPEPPEPETEPETAAPEPEPEAEPAAPEPEPSPETETEITVASDSTVGAGSEQPLAGRITNAGAGEYLLPVPRNDVWNADETKVLLYRTGSVDPGHVVIDARSHQVVATLELRAPDIEQLYWHPGDPGLIVYASDASLVAYDLASGSTRVLHAFDGCERVDSGTMPVPASDTGLVSLLCYPNNATDPERVDQVTIDLATGNEKRVPLPPAAASVAAFPSPSGTYLVRPNSDGSATVLDANLIETGVDLDLGGNPVDFVTDASGQEWAIATLFDGDLIGSVVAMPLEGPSGAGVVVIGPQRGDPYPPSGTIISTSGSTIVISVAGDDDGALAGRVLRIELADAFGTVPGDVASPIGSITSVPHNSQSHHEYWSDVFVSVSPSGDFVAYSAGGANQTVDTFIATIDP